MTSKLIVNSLAADTGVSTITFADQAKMGNSLFHSTGFTIGDSFLHSTGVNLTNVNATGVITATKFVGEVSVGSSITFEDNEKAYFGTGTDFSIYHNGSASYLDETGTGGLIVKTDTAFQVFNSAGSQPAFTVTPGGSVELYHNTTKVLETNTDGILVNGDIGITMANNYSFWIDKSGNKVRLGDNIKLEVGNTGDIEIFHNGSNSFLRNNTGYLVISSENGSTYYDANNHYFRKADSSEFMGKFLQDGAAELYHNGTKRFETSNTGVNLTNHSYSLISGAMGSTENIKISNTTSGGYIQIGMQQQDSDGLHHRAYIKARKGSAGIAGKLELLARGSGGGTNRGWIIDAAVGIQANQQVLPETNNTYDLGSSTKTWKDFYLSGAIISSGKFESTSAAPLIFTNNSNTDSLKKTVIYANYNNTSNHAYNGLLVEMGHLTNSVSGEIRKFTIGERGGQTNAVIDQNGIHFTGGSTNPTITASNGLDDYEEGTFTPTLVQGYNNITYNSNAGFYTKIGNFVSYSIYLYVQGAGGDNAQIRISLPFTTKNQQYMEEGAYIVYDANFLSSSNDSISNCYIMSGRNYSYLRLFKNHNAASIKGNETLLGTGANNVYLLLKGFLTTA